MLLETMLSRRGLITRSMLSRGQLLYALIAAITVAALGIAMLPGSARAEVGGTDQFMPRSWQPGSQPARASRATPPRRGTRVTATTQLEEFDVPRRSTTRVVERKRQPRRVRVAALPRTSDASPRRAVPRRTQATRVAALPSTSDAAPQRTVQRRAAQGTRVASLGRSPSVSTAGRPTTSLTGGGIAWRASAACLAGNLRSIVGVLATSYGAVTVSSTCRSRSHNRRVGGASRSWHLTGNAVDFRIRGTSISRVYAYLRGTVGGLKHYGGGRFHIDNGPRRSF